MGIGSVFDAISAPEAVEHVTRIGYPSYIVPFLGVAKIAGIIVILIPGFPRLKEWAYAGLMIDVVGALYSHIAFGDSPENWIGLIVGIILIMSSYFLYHKVDKVKQRERLQTSLAIS
jgi:uncharacterized membrane protein